MFPENIEKIHTNLPTPRLKRIIKAIDKEKARHVSGSTSMFAESAACDYDFGRARYHITEFVEEVTSLYVVSGKEDFIQTLINEHEVELSAVIKARDFDKAKEINEKIESLKKLFKKDG